MQRDTQKRHQTAPLSCPTACCVPSQITAPVTTTTPVPAKLGNWLPVKVTHQSVMMTFTQMPNLSELDVTCKTKDQNFYNLNVVCIISSAELFTTCEQKKLNQQGTHRVKNIFVAFVRENY